MPETAAPNTAITVMQLQGYREYLHGAATRQKRARTTSGSEEQRAQHLAQYRAYRAALETFDVMLADAVVIALVDPLSAAPAVSGPNTSGVSS